MIKYVPLALLLIASAASFAFVPGGLWIYFAIFAVIIGFMNAIEWHAEKRIRDEDFPE